MFNINYYSYGTWLVITCGGFLKSLCDFEKINTDEAKLSVSECVCVSVRPSIRRLPYLRNQRSDGYQFDMVTASVTRIHHVLINVTLNVYLVSVYLNREHNKHILVDVRLF